jgi:hypothetical protein
MRRNEEKNASKDALTFEEEDDKFHHALVNVIEDGLIES